MVSIVKEISSKIRGVIRNLSKSKNELFTNRIEALEWLSCHLDNNDELLL